MIDKQEIIRRVEELRELVWSYDIPSPTISEYREHHECIQKILRYIDVEILGKII